MSQKDNPYLTITLTGRPPVKIEKAAWPVLASASEDRNDDRSGTGTQANREWMWRVTIRVHADGRKIVYGVYDYDTRYQGEAGASHRAGKLIGADDDVIVTISSLCDEMESRVGDGVFARLYHECVAALPAEMI